MTARIGRRPAAVSGAGSVTITVDGADLFSDAGRTTALACRTYYTPAGLAGLPTVDQLMKAIIGHERRAVKGM